jgi:hypothetical protein
MNCFSARTDKHQRWILPVLMLLVAACGVPDSESADRSNSNEYSVSYTLEADPAAATVYVSMNVRQPPRLLRELSFSVPPHVTGIEGDGELWVQDDRAYWLPPANGGTLKWQAAVLGQRENGRFDALLTADWGIFRAEDIIPRARVRTRKGAVSRTTLRFDLPAGWSAISEYSARVSPIVVDRPARRFDQPAGWLAMGRLGIRREIIDGSRVAVAAPEGHDVRRMEMLALLNWTLPELNQVLPNSLPRLTIVSAGDPMWRGGLSAPSSFFLHADRPLISENATSPLLHEVMHTALGISTQKGFDWIAEGLAEYYSIDLLRRGKAITPRRAAIAYEQQADWSEQATTLCGETSTGATTAFAVTVFRNLDREISEATDDTKTLDALLPLLAGETLDLAALVAAVEEITGSSPDALHIDKLPACRTIAAGLPNS